MINVHNLKYSQFCVRIQFQNFQGIRLTVFDLNLKVFHCKTVLVLYLFILKVVRKVLKKNCGSVRQHKMSNIKIPYSSSMVDSMHNCGHSVTDLNPDILPRMYLYSTCYSVCIHTYCRYILRRRNGLSLSPVVLGTVNRLGK